MPIVLCFDNYYEKTYCLAELVNVIGRNRKGLDSD